MLEDGATCTEKEATENQVDLGNYKLYCLDLLNLLQS